MRPTTVVVPCYNEAERLDSHAFTRAVDTEPNLSLSFVDDGSTDRTLDVLQALCTHKPNQLRVLSSELNAGKAEAVRRGVCAALDAGSELVGYFDADLATPLSAIAPMSRCFDSDEIQLVLGSRVGLLGRNVVRSPRRHYLGRVFATAASQVLGLTVYDTQCGAKIFRNTKLARAIFGEPFCTRWSFDVEILARFLRAAHSGEIPPLERCALEMPLTEWRDVAGSKLGLWDCASAAGELVKIWGRYRVGS